jgi:hypothetical protein
MAWSGTKEQKVSLEVVKQFDQADWAQSALCSNRVRVAGGPGTTMRKSLLLLES